MKKITIAMSAFILLSVLESSNIVVKATEIYNPMNPFEQIKPTGPAQSIPEEENPVQTQLEEPQVPILREEYPNPEPPKKQVTTRKPRPYFVEDIFSEESVREKVVLPPSLGKGGDPPSIRHYVDETLYLLTGTALYGTKANERENVYVYNVFK